MYQLTSEQITQDIQDLPTLPGLVMDILNNIDQEDVDVRELAEKVSRDLALTAKTLRFANSAYYTTMVKVTTIDQAISLLGLNQVRQIIITAALTGCFPENNCPGFSHLQFWRHSNLVAIVARLLARHLKFNPVVAGTAGILHDIGTLVLVSRHSEAYAEVLRHQEEKQLQQMFAERHILGTDHAAVGEALAQAWMFSEQMTQAIAYHHQPERPGAGFLATIIHVANGITHAITESDTAEVRDAEISALSWQSLGISEEDLQALTNEAADLFVRMESEIDL